MKGKLDRWIEGKGYGFIKVNNESYFLHISQMRDGIKPQVDDMLKFDVVETSKGKQAQNVIIL